jgi:hypothetical protein
MQDCSQHMAEFLGALLPDIQLTCCWATALARIWPGGMLAAADRVGETAAAVLLLCSQYLQVLQAAQLHNKTVQALQQHADPQGTQGLMQLPAADITAAVMHTVQLLLLDLGRHIKQQQERPQRYNMPSAVQQLLLEPGALQSLALPLLVLYGNQLQLHLLQAVQQQQAARAVGQPNTTGSSTQSEVVMQSSQLQQLLPADPAMVHTWQQQFESFWCDALPSDLLLKVPAAIATAADTSASKSALHGQGYGFPQQCMVDADSSGSSSSSSARASGDVATAVTAVTAAAQVFRARGVVDSLRAGPVASGQHSPALLKTVLLLLRAIVAALQLVAAEEVVPAVLACSMAATELAAAFVG